MVAIPLLLICGLSGLAALPGSSSVSGDLDAVDKEMVRDDTYFYGNSPPVYPSREYLLTRIHILRETDADKEVQRT